MQKKWGKGIFIPPPLFRGLMQPGSWLLWVSLYEWENADAPRVEKGGIFNLPYTCKA